MAITSTSYIYKSLKDDKDGLKIFVHPSTIMMSSS